MQFINNTNENIKYRVGTRKHGYDWHNARPGKVVDIPQMLGESLNLTKVTSDDKSTEKNPKDDDSVFAEDQSKTANQEYKTRLIKINGIGKKTAEDIMASYPTEQDLRVGIANDEEIHTRDDVDEKIKEAFK